MINRRTLVSLRSFGNFGVIEKLNEEVTEISIKKARGVWIRKAVVGNNTDTKRIFRELINRRVQSLSANATGEPRNKGPVSPEPTITLTNLRATQHQQGIAAGIRQ